MSCLVSWEEDGLADGIAAVSNREAAAPGVAKPEWAGALQAKALGPEPGKAFGCSTRRAVDW